MQTEFLAQFSKDIDRINSPLVKQSLRKIILRVESADSPAQIPGIKKLSGFKSAYRIRMGDYRIGVFITGNKVQFAPSGARL